jgi:hypothetical protein
MALEVKSKMIYEKLSAFRRACLAKSLLENLSRTRVKHALRKRSGIDGWQAKNASQGI